MHSNKNNSRKVIMIFTIRISTGIKGLREILLDRGKGIMKNTSKENSNSRLAKEVNQRRSITTIIPLPMALGSMEFGQGGLFQLLKGDAGIGVLFSLIYPT